LLTANHEEHVATHNKPRVGKMPFAGHASIQIDCYFLYANLRYQVHDIEPAAMIHAKDLAFEDHDLFNCSIARRTSQPRLATNTPKEIVASSIDQEM
jgi:hypothetical protein